MKRFRKLRILKYQHNKSAITPPNYLRPTYFNRIKLRAESRGIEFNVTYEYLTQLFIDQNSLCKYTNVPLYHYASQRLSGRKERCGNASLFRIDRSKGFIVGNDVCWVDKEVMMKRGLTFVP